MANPWAGVLNLFVDRIDADLLPGIYAAVSVSTVEIRAQFEEEGIPYSDPSTGRNPALADVVVAAERVIRDSRNRATAVAAAAGLAGPVAVPPEVLAGIIQTLRLAQRLSVLFGFDPETDAGKVVMFRALAAAMDIELPQQAQVGLKIRDLPALVRSQLPGSSGSSGWIARQVVDRGTAMVVRRVVRLVPGLGMGLAAWGALRRTEQAGAKMVEVFRRATEAVPWDLGQEEIAVEVG